MSAVMTEADVRMYMERLKRSIRDWNGHLRSAEKALDDGELIKARQELAGAIRDQIHYVKKYDTTGRIASQTQELSHIRTRLLKGTTWDSCCRLFKKWKSTYDDVKSEPDTKAVEALGKVASVAIAVGKVISNEQPDLEADRMAGAQVARVVGMVYAPLKAAFKTSVSSEGRQSVSNICRGVYEVAREKAEKVMECAKKIVSDPVRATEKVVVTGYSLARKAAQKASAAIDVVTNVAGRGWAMLKRLFC